MEYVNNQSNDCDLSDQIKISNRNVQTGYSLALHSNYNSRHLYVSKDIKELKPGEKLFGSLDSNCVIIILTIDWHCFSFCMGISARQLLRSKENPKPRVGSKFFTDHECLNQLAEVYTSYFFFCYMIQLYYLIIAIQVLVSKKDLPLLLILLIAAFIILLIAALICGSKCKLKTP